MNSPFRIAVLASCWLGMLASGARAQHTFEGQTLDQWSEKLTASEGKERQHAAQAIAELAGRRGDDLQIAESYSQLVQLLSDDDAAVRYWGVRGVAWFAEKLPAGDGGRQAAASTLNPLLKDPAPQPRITAAETLAHLGDPRPALTVLTASLEDRSEAVRLLAATALEGLGNAASPAKAALRKAASDQSPKVQKIARRILKRLEDDSGGTP